MLEINNLQYRIGTFSLGPLSITVERGEYVALTGPSGCGKSLLLELICGMRRPNSGSISIEGKDIENLKTRELPVSMLFQDYALFPNMTVAKNIAFPLEVLKLDKQKIKESVETIAKEFSIEQHLNRYPNSLSGGEKQRVALARAIIKRPSILLLDEPLSALDSDLREEAIDVLIKIKSRDITIIHVTHDRNEIVRPADREINLKGSSNHNFGT